MKYNILQGEMPHSMTWYVYELIYLYIAFYATFKYIRTTRMAINVVWLISIVTMIGLNKIGWGGHWYMSILAFPAGLEYRHHEERVRALFVSKPYTLIASLFFLPVILYTMNRPGSGLLQVQMAMFAVGLVLFHYVLGSPKSKVLAFLGSISYEMYLIHGLLLVAFPISLLPGIPVWLYIILIVVLSVPFAYAMKTLCLRMRPVLNKAYV